MYHCHLNFYCVGHEPEIFSSIQAMPPLDPFTHAFFVGSEPVPETAASADVILADLRNMNARTALDSLTAAKQPQAELIVLAGRDQLPALLERPAGQVKDIWLLPMEEAELRFRFSRWQETCKLRHDAWQSSHYLDAMMDNSPNLIWFKARDGIHEKVNESFCRTVRKTKEQVEGQGHAYIWDVDGEDPACVTSDLGVMESKRTQVSEEHIQTSEGERILSTYKSPLYDWDGSVMGTVGEAMDVTEERTYAQKNSAMNWLFTTMECGVLCHTVDGSRIININRAALHILGYQSQEEMEAAGFDMVAPSVVKEDQPKLRQCIQSLRQLNDSADVQYRVRHPDGSIIHVLGNIKMIEEKGELYYQRFLLDFTAQKLREEAAQQTMDRRIKYQEQLFKVFFAYLSDNTDDIYLMLNDSADQVEYISPNVERVLGLSPEEIQGDPSHFSLGRHFISEAVTPEILRNMRPGEALEPRETERVNQKTGERRWFIENIYCVSLQNEKRILAYISDRTKERKVQDTLAQALDMAQVANEAKSAFLSGVSHDIRTPMNAIMGFTTLLCSEADNPDRVREYAQRIDAASQHLLGLINNVLDLNNLESGTAALKPAELDLADVIDEVNTIIRPQARAKDQAFRIQVSALAHEHLIGDQPRIKQILINILSNAVKYTQKSGTITMTVTELHQAVKNYSRIRFTISDNGQGMSESYQKVIFAPFTREQDTGTNQVQGSGLGMSVTKSLVDLMGGSIQVQSQLGKGSTFTVELELQIQQRTADLKFWKECGVSRMLVADGSPELCGTIQRAMKQTGVEIDCASNGPEALALMDQAAAGKKPYHLILLDWDLFPPKWPEVSRLSQEIRRPGGPLFLFTVSEQEEAQRELPGVSAGHFLSKPFFMRNFKEAVRRLTEERAKQAAPSLEHAMDGKRIMVVDDIDVNRMILAKILSSMGAVCETAVNGQEAVEKFQASPPGFFDMIMMDIQMPLMNGYDATKAIRAGDHPSAKDVAIIAMTANAFVDDVRKALAAGMDAHLAKPIVVNTMLSTMQEVLSSKKDAS